MLVGSTAVEVAGGDAVVVCCGAAGSLPTKVDGFCVLFSVGFDK